MNYGISINIISISQMSSTPRLRGVMLFDPGHGDLGLEEVNLTYVTTEAKLLMNSCSQFTEAHWM